jgi:N-methylhydantoinase A/oxoprolinase/acetone carboxylase beta subunit
VSTNGLRAASRPLRVGVDVGGTFTKAVAVAPDSLELSAEAVVPTTHRAGGGVSEGVAGALRELLARLGDRRRDVELVAFSTTQAMNALLEGDVARVGVVGIGAAPDLRRARRRTRVGRIGLAPGHDLETEHVFLDATAGLAEDAVDEALARLADAGCRAVAVSGAFAVDAPEHERLVAERALRLGLPACAGHELTQAYGLETRTVSAALNASILPVVERTAAVVEGALREAGLDVPLLVLRGDGGAMGVSAFRRAPSLTVGSGPSAGVAAALHQLALTDAIVLECGGTSSNVSVVKRGRTALRTLKVMGRPTSLRSIDSWVVGAAGGSMARLRGRRIAEVGPRSAHIAGLGYASLADPADLEGAELELVAPRGGDPDAYAVVRARGGRYAITATCAANALGAVPAGAYCRGSRESAMAAFAALARRLRTDPEAAARAMLDAAAAKVADAAAEAAREHDLDPSVPVVALGGAGDALAPAVAERLGRPLLRPEHAPVLSSIGAALSLVRAEVARTAAPGTTAQAVAHEAERACVDAGAAPATVAVESSFDARRGLVRAVATGAAALEAGAARRDPVDDASRLRAAAEALGIEGGALQVVGSTDFYRVYSENGRGRVAVVDARGAVPLAENARRILAGERDRLLDDLRDAVSDATVNLGVATMLPRVALICGPRILDMSDARRGEEIAAAAERALAEHDGDAVAVLWR